MADKAALKKIREANIANILRNLAKHGSMSRVELAEGCGIVPSTVTQLVGSLLESGIVEEFKTGDSTGGRPPVYIRIAPDCGCILIFEIKRNGVTASVFDMQKNERERITISTRMLTGNTLLNEISRVIQNIQSGNTPHPKNIVCVGLLCQEDIPEHELTTLYSTTFASEIVTLETAIQSRFGMPVRKGLIERFSLEYFVNNCGFPCRNYAYINIGERITASFTLNSKPVEIGGATTFDLTSLLSGGAIERNLLNEYRNRKRMVRSMVDMAENEYMMKTLSSKKIAEIIRNANVFFRTEVVFLGGRIPGLDKVADEVSELLDNNPAVKHFEISQKNVTGLFLKRLIDNSIGVLAGI